MAVQGVYRDSVPLGEKAFGNVSERYLLMRNGRQGYDAGLSPISFDLPASFRPHRTRTRTCQSVGCGNVFSYDQRTQSHRRYCDECREARERERARLRMQRRYARRNGRDPAGLDGGGLDGAPTIATT